MALNTYTKAKNFLDLDLRKVNSKSLGQTHSYKRIPGGETKSEQINNMFWWGGVTESDVERVYYDFVGMSEDIGIKDMEVLNALIISYNTRRNKESNFMKNAEIDLKRIKTIPKAPMINENSVASNLEGIRNYVRSFNDFVQALIAQNLSPDSPIGQFCAYYRDQNNLDRISGQVSKIFSTEIAKKAGVELPEFYRDLSSLFYTTDRTKRKDMKKAKISMENFYKKYFPTLSGSLNDEKIYELLAETTADIFKNEVVVLSDKFKRSTSRDKGVSSAAEQKFKAILKKSFEEVAQKVGANEVFQDRQNLGIEIFGGFKEQKDTYSYWTSEIYDSKDEYSAVEITNQAIECLFKDVLSHSGKGEYEAVKNMTQKEKASITTHFRRIINTHLTGKENPTRERSKSKQEVLETISSWSPNHTKGFIGELIVALEMEYAFKSESNETKSYMTGSDRVSSGQLPFDIVLKIKNGAANKAISRFGFQVKNYKGEQISNLYATEVNPFNPSQRQKYFGKKDGERLKFLLGNGRIYTGSYRGFTDKPNVGSDPFGERFIKTMYKYMDNFLRISAGDIDNFGDLSSDVYVIGDKYVPASYLIFLILQQFESQLTKKADPLFKLSTKDFYENPNLKDSPENSVSLDARLGSTYKLKVIFKGISINLKNIWTNI